jgi:hypothetical protein
MRLTKLWHILTRLSSGPSRIETGTTPKNSLAKLFISYAREDDEPFVERLYRDLTERGFAVWWDREAMESRGRTFLQEIRDAMESSDRVIAVIGPKAVVSQYVRYEWEHAYIFCKGIVPILRKGEYDLIPSEFLRKDGYLAPPELSKLHCPDFRNERPYDQALAELVHVLSVPVPPLGSFRSTPPLPAHFLVRRREIELVLESITADVRRPIVVTSVEQTATLQGMAGVGKSVLAAAVARATETRRVFEHGVVWLRVGQTPDLLQKMRELGAALGDDVLHYQDLDTARGKMQQLLQNKVCLIVLDDVWNVEHVEPFQGALGPRCRLLITSRDGAIATALGAQEHRLNVLSNEEASALLAAWTEERFDAAAAVEAASEVENLPFALALCGAMIRDGVSWTDLIAALRDADMAFLDRRFPSYPYRDVFKALQVSVDFLSRSNPMTAELYRELAVFPAAIGVPEAAVLTLWLQRPGMTERNARGVLVTLERKALLKLEGSESARRVVLHSLQYDYLRQLAGDLAPLHARLLQAYRSRGADGWATVPDDGYFYDHAASHFIGAGRADDLYALIEDRSWYEAKRALDPTLYSYVEDVKVALQWAGRKEAVDIPRIVAYNWLLSSVTSAVKEVPVDALEALVVLGKSDQALRHVEMISDVHRYVWVSRRLIELLVARGELTKAREVSKRAVSRASAADAELGSELARNLPPLAETLAALLARNQEQARTTLRNLFQYYDLQYSDSDPEAILEPDRQFILLSPIESNISLHKVAVGIGKLTKWWITQVDFPETASTQPTVNEDDMFKRLPLLSLSLGTEQVDKDLVRGIVAEILAQVGEAERALAVAASVKEPMTRLDVMSLALRAFAERESAEVVAVLWSELAQISTDKYAGATPERVRILMRVADACMQSKIAEEAMKKAHSLCTFPGLMEAIALGRAVDETLNRELAARLGRERLAEELFGGGGDYSIVEAQCLLAEKVVRDSLRFGEAGAELLKTANSLLERAIRHLEEEMKDADRVKALCSIAGALQVFGLDAESAATLQRAENLAKQLDQDSQAQAMATIASTLVRLGNTSRADELLRRALLSSEGAPDNSFRMRFLSAWVKVLIETGDVDRALTLARSINDKSARLLILSEAVVSLARSGRQAQGLEIVEEMTSLAETPPETVDSAVLNNLAIGLALADKTTDAQAFLERAVARAKGAEPASARLEELIRVIRALVDAGLNNLAFEVCEKIDHIGIQAVLFAALLRDVARREVSDEDFANLFLWAAGTAANAGAHTYYLPIAMLMASRALKGSEREAAITSRLHEQLRVMAAQVAEGGASAQVAESDNEERITPEVFTANALGVLSSLGQRDQQIGTLRVANALRIAAGIKEIPLKVFRESSLLRIWEMVTAEAAKEVEDQATTDQLRQGLRELGQRGGISWLENHFEGSVSVLAEDGLAHQTWQRIETVTKLFSERRG